MGYNSADGDMLDNTRGFYQLVMRKHACRLRYVLHQLTSGRIDIEDLRKNLEYAALLLETAYNDESRRICDGDEEMDEVETAEFVPSEVKDWLSATFTRKQVKVGSKRSFKSVANAIRTGIFFDRLFKNQAPESVAVIPENIQAALRDVNNWDFDVYHLQSVCSSSLRYIGLDLFNKYGLLAKYRIPPNVLDNFLQQLEVGYSKHNNPYHNLVHAADVTQTAHYMISQTGLLECLSELEVFACLFSAMIHDYEHTGHTNNFHVQSGSDFALLYNDRSVLENHHSSACFRLLKESDKNIVAILNKDEYREFRNLVVEIVLATDMSTHFVQVKQMKNMLSLPEKIDKAKVLSLMIHCCDISHPTKPWNLHTIWTDKVSEEFFRQGDLEASLGLPYSPLCDRNSVHLAESQIGFIDFIVEPSMLVCGDMLNKMIEPLVLISHTESETENEDKLDCLLKPSRKLPLSLDGKLNIPQPWMDHMAENKRRWKEQAAIDERRRKVNQMSKELNDIDSFDKK